METIKFVLSIFKDFYSLTFGIVYFKVLYGRNWSEKTNYVLSILIQSIVVFLNLTLVLISLFGNEGLNPRMALFNFAGILVFNFFNYRQADIFFTKFHYMSINENATSKMMLDTAIKFDALLLLIFYGILAIQIFVAP